MNYRIDRAPFGLLVMALAFTACGGPPVNGADSATDTRPTDVAAADTTSTDALIASDAGADATSDGGADAATMEDAARDATSESAAPQQDATADTSVADAASADAGNADAAGIDAASIDATVDAGGATDAARDAADAGTDSAADALAPLPACAAPGTTGFGQLFRVRWRNPNSAMPSAVDWNADCVFGSGLTCNVTTQGVAIAGRTGVRLTHSQQATMSFRSTRTWTTAVLHAVGRGASTSTSNAVWFNVTARGTSFGRMPPDLVTSTTTETRGSKDVSSRVASGPANLDAALISFGNTPAQSAAELLELELCVR